VFSGLQYPPQLNFGLPFPFNALVPVQMHFCAMAYLPYCAICCLCPAALLPSLPGITSASNNNILGLATSAGAGAGAAPAVAAATGLGGGPGLMQQHRGMGSPSAVQPPTPRQ
jgi:hypothetical protein